MTFDSNRLEAELVGADRLIKAAHWDCDRYRAEIERLLALLQEAVPYIEGAQNTTSVEAYRTAGELLEKIRLSQTR